MKQIEKAINAMVIDWSHAATGNRIKWAFTSDTSRDDIEMVIAVYRKNARRPYMVIFPIYNTMRGMLNTCNAPVIEGEAAESIKGDYMKGIENVNTFKVTGSPYDNDGMSIYAPAIEAAKEPAEAPQTADNDSTTDNTPAIMETVENAHKSRYSARQTAPLTFAIWDNVKNTPAIETTSNGIMAYMEIFGIDHIDTDTAEPTDADAADTAPDAPITETERRAALDRLNHAQNAANLFTNITPADIDREVMRGREAGTPRRIAAI